MCAPSYSDSSIEFSSLCFNDANSVKAVEVLMNDSQTETKNDEFHIITNEKLEW